MIKSPLEYLQAIDVAGYLPNFWCSEEYFEKSGAVMHSSGLFNGPMVDNLYLAPPLHQNCITLFHGECLLDIGVWADLPNSVSWGTMHGTLSCLDYEFLYNPRRFLELSGKPFATFRKNVRKWPVAHPGSQYVPLAAFNVDGLLDVVIQWTDGHNEEIHDVDVMGEFLANGENRKGLFTAEGELVAINIWDTNYKYTNFRYNFCKPQPFLSEYSRLLFYTDPEILDTGKLVNDGGTLGKESLLFFKKRLQPVATRFVYSWQPNQ